MGEEKRVRQEEADGGNGGVALTERSVEVTTTVIEGALLPDVSQKKVASGRASLGVLIGLGGLAIVAVVLATMVLSSIQRKPEAALLPEETSQVEDWIPTPSPIQKEETPSAGEQLWGDRMNQLQEGRKRWYIFGDSDIWDYVDNGHPTN